MAHGGGDLWTVEEAGAYLGVSRSTLYRLARRGDLVMVHVGARVSVLAASVLAFRDRAVSAATPPHGLPLGPWVATAGERGHDLVWDAQAGTWRPVEPPEAGEAGG